MQIYVIYSELVRTGLTYFIFLTQFNRLVRTGLLN
jgi:hypothetical protein